MLAKTKILTLMLFSLLFLNLSAQDGFENDPVANLPDEDRTFRFGLMVNPGMSWFKTNTAGYASNGSKTSFSFGLSFEYFMTNNYLISSGLFISNQSGKLKNNGATQGLLRTYVADEQSTFNMKYIEIPLTLKLRTNEIGYFTYFANFGLNTGFNFSANASYAYTYDDFVSPLTQTHNYKVSDAKSGVNFINMALVIGAGVEYNISGNTSLVLGVTFYNGFISQTDVKQYAFDANGEAQVPLAGGAGAVYSDKEVSAILNNLALNLGIYF